MNPVPLLSGHGSGKPQVSFLTEEINEMFFQNNKYLIKSAWPKTIEIDRISKNSITLIINIISAIRSYRVEKNISFKNQINLYVKTANFDKKVIINSEKDLIFFLGRIKAIIEVIEDDKKDDILFIPIEDVIIGFEVLKDIDTKKEKELLLIKQEKVIKDLSKLENMLSNTNFVNKAPNEVILKTRNQINKLLDEKEELTKSINKL